MNKFLSISQFSFQKIARYFILICYLLFGQLLITCQKVSTSISSSNLVQSNSNIDLLRFVQSQNCTNFKFIETKDLSYHKKKNPSRFSQLTGEQKWQITQITFNTDKKYFVNESKESLLFSPNSKCTIKFPKGDYQFYFSLGGLDANSFGKLNGRLDILSNHINIYSKEFNNQTKEQWTDISIDLKQTDHLDIIWTSKSSYLFLGYPYLYNSTNSKSKNNIILIVIDSVRKDALGYAGQYPSSPQIDQIAEESIVFTNTFSNANWTKPSMISMFYSNYSSNLAIANTGFKTENIQKSVFYSSKNQSLPNYLRQKGYFTHSSMNNVFLLDYTGVGVDIGFQSLYQVGKDNDDTEKIIDNSIQFVRAKSKIPFFLHINLNTPHGPYTPPFKAQSELNKALNEKKINHLNTAVKLYLAEIYYADQQIGRLIDTLKSLNLYDNSYIVITSDHGELLGTKRNISHLTDIKYGHGLTQFDDELGIPLLIKPPKSIVHNLKNKRIEKQTSLLSLFPTLIGLESLDKCNTCKGTDHSAYIFGNTNVQGEEYILSEGRMAEAIRTESYKFIQRFPGFVAYMSGNRLGLDNLIEVYDLKNDPLELKNIKKESNSILEFEKAKEKISLKTNTYHLHLPVVNNTKTQYKGTITLYGGIYRIESMQKFGVQVFNQNTFSIDTNIHENQVFNFSSVRPDLRFDLKLYRNGKLIEYRIGQWGISHSKAKYSFEPEVLVSHFEPPNFLNSELPWIYSKGQMSGNYTNEYQKEISSEVRSILRSWGYIHE